MSYLKGRIFWAYEIGVAIIFMIVSVLAFARTDELRISLCLFAEGFVVMQPIVFGLCYVDSKYRRGSGDWPG